MKHKKTRVVTGLLTAFVALTAIGGGIALLSGAEANRFPLEWLQGTPFQDYTIPALLLAIAVGGSALVASIAIFTGRNAGALAAMIAGLILASYIVVEVLTLKQVPPGPTAIEQFYLALALAIIGLAAFLSVAENRQKRDAGS